jgi:hypothetical protein
MHAQHCAPVFPTRVIIADFSTQIMARHRITHVSYDHLVSLVFRDQAALDDPGLPMPGGWTHTGAAMGFSSSLGDLSRDVTGPEPGAQQCVCVQPIMQL